MRLATSHFGAGRWQVTAGRCSATEGTRMEEFDFNAGRVVSYQPMWTHSRAALRRTLAVVATIGVLTGLAAVGVEYRFWWLTLTGQRATAEVTSREEHIIGWAFT